MSEAGTSTGPSMLLAFRAENARSFDREFELSLLATRLSERGAARSVPWREGGREIEVLAVAGVFGANASGKSNVIKAMGDMRAHVLHSFRGSDPLGGFSRRPFLLGYGGDRRPSRYEVDLVVGGIRYEYGFLADDQRVIEEWAYHYPRGRPALLFRRDGETVVLGPTSRAKGRAVADLLRPNALYLSTAAAANYEPVLPLYSWFDRNLLLAEGGSRPFRQALTTQLLGEESTREQVLALLRAADLGVVDARRLELDPETKARVLRALRILVGEDGEGDEGPAFEELGVRLVHRGGGGDVELDAQDESFGTLVWFGLVGPVVKALTDGTVLLADELDASLHPALVAQLIGMFQNEASNPRRAQLVFNTHDVTILGESSGTRLVGRDQIWFTEKSSAGGTRLYPLSDLDPRKEEAVARRYLAGRYGAVPILSSSEFAATAEMIVSGDRIEP